jgi:hypothetical protein
LGVRVPPGVPILEVTVDKDKLKVESKKWSKRLAFLAVFGITGAAAVLAVNVYRSIRGLDDIDWDNLEL